MTADCLGPSTGVLGTIDRTIDQWETQYSPSTIKNTIALLVRVLDEAVRDDLIGTNPARNRSRRSFRKNALATADLELSPRDYALPDLASLQSLAAACGAVHQCYSDYVMLSALIAARGSEVADLQVGDVDWESKIVTIRRQTFPGAGGLVPKPTKGRTVKHVPILGPLTPVLERLTDGREPEARLLTGPRGGVLTTATVRDATQLERHRRRPGAAYFDSPWAGPHGRDLARRRRHPDPRPAMHPRAPIARDHRRLFAL